MAVERIVNTVEKGCDLDSPPRFQPPGTHRHAKNMVPDTRHGRSGGKTNERSFKKRVGVPGRKAIGYMRVEERNATIIYHVDGGACLSIFYHDTNEIKLIAKDKDFGCDWKFTDCMWIGHGFTGSKTIAPCNDLLVYWTSDDFIRVANVDELLDPKRKAAIKELEEPCEHFQLVKKIHGPRPKMRAMRGGGKDLEPGQYYVAARYKDESGNTSNFTAINGPVYIGSKHNIFGEKSKQAIRVEVRDLSKHYSRVEIVIIPPIGSVSQDIAYTIYDGVYNTNGVSMVYYSASQHLSSYTLAQILVKDVKWIRPHKFFIDDARINPYQLRHEFNINYQKHANKIKTTFLAYAVPADQAHLFKTLPWDEPLAFGIGLQSLDGTWSPFFHIRGVTGGVNDLDCGCDLPPGHTGNNSSIIRKYVTFEGKGNTFCFTSGQTTTSNPTTTDTYNPPSVCAESETPITPRVDDGTNCNNDTTYKKAMDDNIKEFESRPADLASCQDCAPDAVRRDVSREETGAIRSFEKLNDLFRTDKEVYDDCSIGKFDTIPEAAHDGYEKAIKDAVKNEEIQYRTIVEKKDGTDFIMTAGEGGKLTRVTVKADDCSIEDVVPILLAEFSPAGWESRIPYPKTKDCDDKYFHEERAGLPILHPKTPAPSLFPQFITGQTGVESRFDPSNLPCKRDTYVVILGVRFTNIHEPTGDELFKPLNKNEPFRIGIVPPQEHNASNLYHGYVTPTFGGKIGEKTYAFPRHAVSAFPSIDRSIDDKGSRLGFDWDEKLYNFHTPDIESGSSFVYADYVQVHGFIEGVGQVYGGYAKGKHVKEDENRKDRRGSRGALTFSTFTPHKFSTCVKGAEVAEFNSVLHNPAGVSKPFMNKHRESSIAFETEEALPENPNIPNNKDKSFTGGGLDHEYFTSGGAWLVSFKRFNAEQYGSIESLQYADLGLSGKTGQTSVEGPVGTAFIQKWSHKRTSFISDKVGNFLNEDLAGQFPLIATEDFLGPVSARKRGVADPPNRKGSRMEEYLGFWNSMRLPMPGDKRDPKNMCNLHPTKSAQEIANGPQIAETDLFFERTHVQLNHLILQTNVNLHFRSTNVPATREVFYEELQGLDLDSSIAGVDPEDAWLNDYHCQQLQPSDKQQEAKIKLRVFLGLIAPALLLAGFAGINAPIQEGHAAIAAPGLMFLWALCNYSIFTSKKIDKFKGLPWQKIDKEGAQEEDNTRGLKDNWAAYNWGFSDINDLNTFLGQPFPYNTCKCTGYSNNIRSSNKQIHTSPHDAWSNFQALSLMGLQGDSGLLQLVVVWANSVLAHTTDGVYPLQHKNQTVGTSVGEQLLGSSQYFPNPSRMRDGAFEGYAGTTDPNAGIIFQGGYVSIDNEGRAINLLGGDGFKKLNDENSGLFKYMQENLPFCSTGCNDFMSPEGTHYAIGFDPKRLLLFITKHDKEPWTWSFNLQTGMFNSMHDYIPDFYFWDRNALFSMKNGEIWEHDAGEGYCNFYGKQFPAMIEIPVHTQDSVPFNYKDSMLDTEVRVGDLHDREATFTDMTAYNDMQLTGKFAMPVKDLNDAFEAIQNRPNLPVTRHNIGLWEFNDLRANEADRDVPVLLQKNCGQPPEINSKNVSFKKTHVTNREILSKFLIFRFEFAGESNKTKASEAELIVTKLITDVEVHDTLRSKPG